MIGPLVRDTVRYVRENDLSTIIRDFNSRDAHPIVQFGKYGICGVAAVIVQVAGFYLFSNWFPSSIASGLGVRRDAVGDAERRGRAETARSEAIARLREVHSVPEGDPVFASIDALFALANSSR